LIPVFLLHQDALTATSKTLAGLDPAWRTDAVAESGMEDRILAEHQDAVERLRAFGVPTLSINGQHGFFWPVISAAPTGEDAGEL
jgi:hypothetical protein